ncbi:molybdopterin converting factor subunit 1 [Comamonas faecalis]|uniref:Molybdopterin converting factor subunit 1 n=1 Tax=Comamonas faecalis TaxID=1387849 RepID=A0ABP7QFB1_9BURK
MTTKTVTLRYFASIRETLGESETLTTDAATLGALRDALIARGGAHAQVLARGKPVRMALNQAMARESQPLPDGGAEVAFFPPVTGG